MFKKLAVWLYLRSVSKKEDIDFFLNTRYDREKNIFINPCERLSIKQVLAIIESVDQEIIKSYLLGLKISREHVIKEKIAILYIINELGNLHSIPKRFEFEEAMSIFSNKLFEIMKEEMLFYFQKLEKQGLIKNMYNCHLESVKDAILQAIYNKQFPYM